MLVGHHSPQKVLDHDGILILPTTVIGVQVYRLLTQPMVYEEVVEHADDGVGPLPHVHCLIDQVIHLSGNRLAAHSKDCTLPGCKKVHGAGLKGVVWVEHLLCHVETVVGRDGSGVGWSAGCWWWWRKCAILVK